MSLVGDIRSAFSGGFDALDDLVETATFRRVALSHDPTTAETTETTTTEFAIRATLTERKQDDAIDATHHEMFDVVSPVDEFDAAEVAPKVGDQLERTDGTTWRVFRVRDFASAPVAYGFAITRPRS